MAVWRSAAWAIVRQVCETSEEEVCRGAGCAGEVVVVLLGRYEVVDRELNDVLYELVRQLSHPGRARCRFETNQRNLDRTAA